MSEKQVRLKDLEDEIAFEKFCASGTPTQLGESLLAWITQYNLGYKKHYLDHMENLLKAGASLSADIVTKEAGTGGIRLVIETKKVLLVESEQVMKHPEILDLILSYEPDMIAKVDLERAVKIAYENRVHPQLYDVLVKHGVDKAKLDDLTVAKAPTARPVISKAEAAENSRHAKEVKKLSATLRLAVGEGKSKDYINMAMDFGASPLLKGDGDKSAVDIAIEKAHINALRAFEERGYISEAVITKAMEKIRPKQMNNLLKAAVSDDELAEITKMKVGIKVKSMVPVEVAKGKNFIPYIADLLEHGADFQIIVDAKRGDMVSLLYKDGHITEEQYQHALNTLMKVQPTKVGAVVRADTVLDPVLQEYLDIELFEEVVKLEIPGKQVSVDKIKKLIMQGANPDFEFGGKSAASAIAYKPEGLPVFTERYSTAINELSKVFEAARGGLAIPAVTKITLSSSKDRLGLITVQKEPTIMEKIFAMFADMPSFRQFVNRFILGEKLQHSDRIALGIVHDVDLKAMNKEQLMNILGNTVSSPNYIKNEINNVVDRMGGVAYIIIALNGKSSHLAGLYDYQKESPDFKKALISMLGVKVGKKGVEAEVKKLLGMAHKHGLYKQAVDMIAVTDYFAVLGTVVTGLKPEEKTYVATAIIKAKVSNYVGKPTEPIKKVILAKFGQVNVFEIQMNPEESLIDMLIAKKSDLIHEILEKAPEVQVRKYLGIGAGDDLVMAKALKHFELEKKGIKCQASIKYKVPIQKRIKEGLQAVEKAKRAVEKAIAIVKGPDVVGIKAVSMAIAAEHHVAASDFRRVDTAHKLYKEAVTKLRATKAAITISGETVVPVRDVPDSVVAVESVKESVKTLVTQALEVVEDAKSLTSLLRTDSVIKRYATGVGQALFGEKMSADRQKEVEDIVKPAIKAAFEKIGVEYTTKGISAIDNKKVKDALAKVVKGHTQSTWAGALGIGGIQMKTKADTTEHQRMTEQITKALVEQLGLEKATKKVIGTDKALGGASAVLAL